MHPMVYVLLRNKRFVISMSIFITIALAGIAGPLIYTKSPLSFEGPAENPPSSKYPLGTDLYGRDILAQLLWGIRNSLYIGILTAIIAASIGLLVGSVAGIKGGIIDEILMAVTNIVLSIPNILLAILIASYIKFRSVEIVALLLGVTSWPWLARAVRAQLMSLREREFVYLSKMAGYSDLKIAFTDLLPNMASYIFMAFAGFINTGILGEVGLSIMGIGPTRGVTLGVMLQWAALMEAIRRGIWWWFIPPGLVIVATTSSLTVMATALDEVLNPRLRRG
ncbi:MAG: ABC transporter permease [Ignisphaera sp.]